MRTIAAAVAFAALPAGWATPAVAQTTVNAVKATVTLNGGRPVVGTQGIALDTDHLALKVVDVVDGDWQAAGVLVHDIANRSVAHMLVELPMGLFPVALGVIYDDPKPTYEGAVLAQDAVAREGKSLSLIHI